MYNTNVTKGGRCIFTYNDTHAAILYGGGIKVSITMFHLFLNQTDDKNEHIGVIKTT